MPFPVWSVTTMPKWSDMVGRLIPWTRTEDPDTRHRIVAEAQAVTDEQQALAPFIDEMTEYLVEKAEINGFTRQLRTGFERRQHGE